MDAKWSRQTLARNLRHYMNAAGKSQKEMAEVAGVTLAAFNDWINEKKYPRIDRIQRLADYFGIQKSDLIEEHPTDPQVDEVSEERREFLQFIDSVPDAELDRLKRMILLALKRDD